jgi:hypothetical protein
MGFPSFSQSIGAFNCAALIEQFTHLMVARSAFEDSLIEIRSEMERQVVEEEARLAEFLGSAA